MKISIDELKELVFKKLNRIYDEDDSKKITEVLISAELCNMGSHGLVRLMSGYYDQLDPNRTGKPQIKKISENLF